MSTQINVTVGGGGLVEEAKRNQEQGRWRQTERERWEVQQSARGAEMPRVDVDWWRRQGVIIRDEPAANRRGSPDGVVLAWTYGLPGVTAGVTTAHIVIECSSRQESVTFDLVITSPEVSGVNWRFIALPAGGDYMVVVVTNAKQLSPGDGRTYVPDWKAAIVSRTAVRQISVPSGFRTAFEGSAYTEDITPEGYPPIYTAAVRGVTGFGFNGSSPDRVPVDAEPGGYGPGTPGWFALLNTPDLGTGVFYEEDAGTGPWIVRHFLAGVKTPRYELAMCGRDTSCPAGRFDVDKFPFAPETETAKDPSLFVASRVKGMPFDSGIPLPTGFEPEDYSFSVAWDWGQPAYCRQQLLALGFTAEDLTP